MTTWTDRILREFTADLARLWIVADPDDVLLGEKILSGLRERGFDVLSFEDSIAFRAEYEERYRAAWDRGESGPSPALILQLRGTHVDDLPWDYQRQARKTSLSLFELFPRLSYSVVRQLRSELLPPLFEAQERHAHQPLGEAATKDFVLTHIFRMSPHFITRHEDLWRELLRLHYGEAALPPLLAQHVGQVVGAQGVFKNLPVAQLFADRNVTLRLVQEAWYRYLKGLGVTGTRIGEPPPPDYGTVIDIPFEHPDVRVLVDSMFLDGTLHPLVVERVPANMPEWVKVGVVKDPASLRNLIEAGVKALGQELPTRDSLHRDWTHFARKMGEVISRFHALDATRSKTLQSDLLKLQQKADEQLRAWIEKHYADLPSLPVAKGPVMVHHVPRFLAMRRGCGEEKIALLVFDGTSLDQWIQIRESVINHSKRLVFDENACFAWLPTLTSVSRQALFSGLRPREFGDSIETTIKEPALWSRFWQDNGLRVNEVYFRKSLKRISDLPDLEAQLSQAPVKVAGMVVDTVDEFVHGAVLGKREIASRITHWCETGFVDRLFELLLNKGFQVYVTSDHGNVEALGIGRPNQGVASEIRGERVRTYHSEALRVESAATYPETFQLEIAGLPGSFRPLFAGERGAFVQRGEQVVAHGGLSVEELFVPFIKVSYVSHSE